MLLILQVIPVLNPGEFTTQGYDPIHLLNLRKNQHQQGYNSKHRQVPSLNGLRRNIPKSNRSNSHQHKIKP